MAPSTACVAPPISRTPPVQQQLQQRQVQHCQPPLSHPHQGQQRSQQHYLQHQNQQHQQHVMQQRLAQQQQQILHRQHPQQQGYSPRQQHLDRLHMLRQQHVQRQPGQGPDDQEEFSRLSFPCPLSLPPDQSSSTAVTAALAHLSHNVPWCSGHTNQDGRDCLGNSAVLTAMQQQVNSTPPSDKRPMPAGLPPQFLTHSEVEFLPAATRTGTLAAVFSARNKSGSNPLPSSVCTLASSGSGLSDTSTSPGDGSTVVSASAACLDSSTPQFAGQSSAATADAVESPTSSPIRRTATSGVVPPHHPVRTPRQQMRNQPQQRQQLQCQPLRQLSQRQPIGSSVQQQQQRPPRQQHGIVSVDSEPALTARHLRCTAATTPTAAAARFKYGYGSRNSMGPQQVSTGPAGNRRVKHQARQQHDQRTELGRQRQTQLPQQQTHCRCTSKGVQQHQQTADISEGALGTSISSYPTVHVVPTGEAGAVSFSSGVLPRAACEDLSLSLDDWNTSRRANADSAVPHHVHGHHASGSSRSSSSLAYMTAVGCEAFANASGGTRGLGLPPLPYLYYDLRIRGGAGWPSASITDSSQTPRNNGNTILRLARVASSQSLEDRATRGKDSLPSSGEAADGAHAPPPTYDMAATAAVHGYTPSPIHVAEASNNACLTLKKPSFDRTGSLAAQKAAKDATAATAGAAATAMPVGITCRTAVHRVQRRLAQHASFQSRSGEFQPQNLHLTPGTAKLHRLANSGATYRNSATPGKPQMPSNRPKVTTAGSESLREQQPTVTLPMLLEPTISKPHATPALQTEEFRLPCGGLVTPARPTLLFEEISLPADKSCFGKGSSTALPRAAADSVESTACKAAGRLAPPALGGFTSSSESGCAAGGAGVNTPVVPVCASRGDACACRSSDHIGRGRGPGRPDLAPGSHSPLAPPGPAAPTTNDSSPANSAQRANGLERTWLRLLCESEAVAEGKVRTCRSSAPIPPAVLLRAPEKLEGHVISSSSRDILRPPFYGLLQGEGISAGEKTVGTDDAAITSWTKIRKSTGVSRRDVEQSGTRQRQVCASTDTATKAGGRGSGGAAVTILETLHLEKLLQSAIYGAVFRANLHTVFRTTRASKKPRQGNENGQDADSRSSSNVTSSHLYATEHEEHINGAHIEFPRGESPATASAAVAERTGRDGGGNNGDVEGTEEDFDRHNIHSQQMRKDCFVEESYCENHDEAIGTIELRSQVVAVKVLSLSLQLRASPSLQEDFLSELKFYPYLKGHKNILVPHRIYVDRAQQLLLLVFPFAEFEDLFEVLKKRKKPFAEAEVQWICKQLLQAVLFLHRRGIAMRDLSLENVLMCRCPETGYAVPKLTDPGQAVIVDQEAAAATRTAAIAERYSAVEGNDGYVGQEVKDDRKNDGPRGRLWCDAACRGGTETSARRIQQDDNDYDPPAVLLAPDKIFGKSFRPPEVYQQCSYNPFKVDSFCVGWMTYYLLTKQQLFQRAAPSDDNWRLLSTKNASDLLLLLGRKNGAVLSVEGLDFVVRLLEDDPERRMTIYQALAHPFIALSNPCPVLADNLFPDDAVTQEQHTAKQRQLHVQLLQQKQRLLQLYTMRWRDQAGLCLHIATEELQHEDKRVQPNHEQPISPDSAPARCEQTHRGVAVYSGLKRTSPGQALLGKCAQSHQRQTSHQQRRELCREPCQNHSRKALSRARGDSAAPDSSRDCNLPDERGVQSISPQPLARECFGDFTTNGEPYVPAAGAKCAATYEEPPDEQPAPTLLVQHSTLLGGSPPTTGTPCRCWSADVEPPLQEAPARCGPPGQNLPACEKQVVNQSPRASWEAEGGCGKQALNGIKQRSGEAATERKERQLQLTMRKKLQCGAIDSDTWDAQRAHTTGSDRVEQSPRAQQFSRYAEESAYASQRQLSQWRLTTKPAFQSGFLQSSTSGKGVLGETIGLELDVCQPKPVLFAPATVQVPVVRVAELPSPVEEDGTAQVQGERASADKGSSGMQSVSDKFSAQGLPHRASTQKHSDSGRAGLKLHSVQDDNETTATRRGGLPDTQKDCIVKATSRTDVRIGVPDAFAAVESSLPVVEHNLQPSTGNERTSARSEQRVLPSSLKKNNKVTQTLQNKMARAGCLFSSVQRTKGITVDCRSKAASEERLGPPVMPSRAVTRKGCTNEISCVVESSGNSRTDSGQRQRHDGVCIKTVNCSFSKGRRGPSSSSTETGSTAGENCGGRSDSDYCVGVRSNGSASHCSRSNVSCEGLQRCVVRPPIALLPGTGKTGRNVVMHGAAASAESL